MGWEIFNRQKISNRPGYVTFTLRGYEKDDQISVRFTQPVQEKYKMRDYPFIRFAYDKRKHWLGFELLERKSEGAYPMNSEFVFGVTGLFRKYNIDIKKIVGHYIPFREYDTDAFIIVDLNKMVEPL